jgi:hypothetical protein
MFSGGELSNLIFVTGGACLGSRDFDIRDIIRRHVRVPMASRAVDIIGAMTALLPIIDNPGCNIPVTVDALLSRSGNCEQHGDPDCDDVDDHFHEPTS